MISLITPVYNTYNLDRVTGSILNQTSKSFEWIIVVDADKSIVSRDALRAAKECHSKVFIVELNSNFGPSVARNVGFSVSSGEVIAYVDSDDKLEVDRIAVLNSLYNDTGFELLFSAYKIVQDGSEFSFYPPTQLYDLLQRGNISIPLGVAHIRKLFMLGGMFQRGIVCGEDGILWRRMLPHLTNGKAFASNLVAGTYYVNKSGQSRTQRRFEQGGFAFDADNSEGSNGQYLDKDWFETYNSVKLFDK